MLGPPRIECILSAAWADMTLNLRMFPMQIARFQISITLRDQPHSELWLGRNIHKLLELNP